MNTFKLLFSKVLEIYWLVEYNKDKEFVWFYKISSSKWRNGRRTWDPKRITKSDKVIKEYKTMEEFLEEYFIDLI